MVQVASIVVLGMHRSGTSAIARAVGRLGASLGPASMLGRHAENIPMRRLNDSLLKLGHGTWDAPPRREWLDDPRVRAETASGRALVAQQFGDAELLAWKDPRTCLTMPFWMEVFDPPVLFLFIHRHPTEVAASLTARNGFPAAAGFAIWERYNADAVRAIAGHPTMVLEYSALLAEPVDALNRTRDAFASAGVVLPNDPATTDHGLTPDARQHSAAEPEALPDIATPSQRALFDMLRELDGPHLAVQLAHPLPEPHPLSVEIMSVAAALRRSRQAVRELNGAVMPEDGSGKPVDAVTRRQRRTRGRTRRPSRR